MPKKRISPGEKVPLKLTPTEVKTILDELMCLDREVRAAHTRSTGGEAGDDDPR